MKKRAALRIALLSAVAFAALSAPAFAQDAGWGDDIEVMADEELDDLRGGFTVGGININFGATVTTILNGVPVLTTNITVTDAGRIVDQTMADVGQTLEEIGEEGREALGLDGLGDDAAGIIIDDEDGVTALVHNVTEGALQNIIVNTATGRDIAQDIDITLDLPGFDFIQGELTMERFGFRLQDDMMGVAFGRGPGG
jgi:hypothetical protein